MTSAVVQAPASVDIVVDALGTLAPGWRDRTGISHDKGWTAVPMHVAAADRFAPLLARLLGAGVLRWEAEAEAGTSRVTFFQPDGEVLGPVDTADAAALEAFAKTFGTRQLLHTTPASGRDRSRLLGEAFAASGDSAERHRTFATVLGVPYVEQVAPADSNPSTPGLSEASVLTIAAPLQRRRRLEQARTVVRYVTYGAGLLAVLSVIEPGWPVNVVVLALALALFGIWILLGWRLKRMRQEQQTAL
jgi:hypothetical protein